MIIIAKSELFPNLSEVIFAEKDPDKITSEILSIYESLTGRTLTQKYTVPMDRLLGMSGEALDEAVSRVRAKYKREVVEAVKKYEPRARVSAIDFRADLNGRIVPRIRVKIVSAEGL